MIAELIRRLLRLLFHFGIYSKHYLINYTGDITSANKIWSSGHWKTRSTTKQKFEKVFTILLLEAKVKTMMELSLVTFYNSRHDVDNLSTLQKILVDAMKGSYIEDDSSKCYKSTHTIFDPKLPKGTIEFHIIGR